MSPSKTMNAGFSERDDNMYNRISLTFCILIISLNTISCSNQEDPSSPKWGYRNDFIGPHTLIRGEYGDKIRVCGIDSETMAWAINVWAQAIDLEYDVMDDCSAPDIMVYSRDSNYARTACSYWNIKNNMFADPYLYPMRVVDCDYFGNRETLILHEVGHLYGLCDQYHRQIHNCSYTTDPDSESVMHSADKTYLTNDDIEGIRAIRHKIRGEVP